jgi:aspartate kinase
MSIGAWRTIVIKLGGSVLRDLASYQACARRIGQRVRSEPSARFVLVVSARFGETDELWRTATSLSDAPDARTLDLLWSTGELRSAATLALCVQAIGVRACALDLHQTGMRYRGELEVEPDGVMRALDRHDVVVVPGFLAVGADDEVVSLGRGGSDLTAVALAAALGAHRCELVKDVPGYFTKDPNRHANAEHLPAIGYCQAMRMADEGCDLVQPVALEAARRAGLELVIRSFDDPRITMLRC